VSTAQSDNVSRCYAARSFAEKRDPGGVAAVKMA
jgi:hypothetical protein